MTEIFTGVRVFDGDHLLDGVWDVRTDRGLIRSVEPAGAAQPYEGEVVDGSGATLLPGLIDAHVHLRDAADLRTLARWGVTTVLDMGTLGADPRRAPADAAGSTCAARAPPRSGRATRSAGSPAARPTASCRTRRPDVGSSPRAWPRASTTSRSSSTRRAVEASTPPPSRRSCAPPTRRGSPSWRMRRTPMPSAWRRTPESTS